MLRRKDLYQLPRTDAGEENHHVVCACEQTVRELECLFIALQRHFPHGRRDERLASIAADKLGGFRCAAAFKRQDAFAGE